MSRHMRWVCGKPCKSSRPGPEPVLRKKMTASGVATSIACPYVSEDMRLCKGAANLMPRELGFGFFQQLHGALGLGRIDHQLHASQRRAEKWIEGDNILILQMTVDTRIL